MISASRVDLVLETESNATDRCIAKTSSWWQSSRLITYEKSNNVVNRDFSNKRNSKYHFGNFVYVPAEGVIECNYIFCSLQTGFGVKPCSATSNAYCGLCSQDSHKVEL